MVTRNDGKKLELAVQEALRFHQTASKLHFFRMYDATSSGGRGHAQDGDFVWLLPNKAMLIECKSTETSKDLLALIKSNSKNKQQLMRHKLWHLSGHSSLYVYGNLLSQQVATYTGESVMEMVSTGNESPPLTAGSFKTIQQQLWKIAASEGD